jgi:hypothetical protein
MSKEKILQFVLLIFLNFFTSSSSSPVDDIIVKYKMNFTRTYPNFTMETRQCLDVRQKNIDCFTKNGFWTEESSKDNYYFIPFNLRKRAHNELWHLCPFPYRAWVWKSNCSCNDVPIKYKYYRSDLCEIMNGRNILVVGDSMSNEFFISFASMFWPADHRLVRPDLSLIREAIVGQSYHNAYRVKIPCDNGRNFTIGWVRNFNLTLNSNINESHYCKGEVCSVDVPRPWVRTIKNDNISFLIVNRGLHMTFLGYYRSDMRALFQFMRDEYPHVQVIFRNTPYGHDNCEKYFVAPPLQKAIPPREGHRYHWDNMPLKNRLMEDLINVDFPEVIYLDVTTSTLLRADSHMSEKDCLHYCIPGPIDNWVYQTISAIKIRDARNCQVPNYTEWNLTDATEFVISSDIVLTNISGFH